MRSIPVRFLEPEEIESAVAEVLRNFSKATGREIAAPVPVEDILEKQMKVTLEIADLVSLLGMSDVLGAAWFDEGVVRVDKRILDQEGRYCFTIGHELGHWVLHRPQLEAEKIAPTLFRARAAPPAVVCRNGDKAPAEWQADRFSAQLLMPKRLVRAAFNQARGDSPIPIKGLNARRDDSDVQASWRTIASEVIKQGNFSNVSNEAMRYRLSDLGLVTDAAQQTLF
jgi:hypothetical protein